MAPADLTAELAERIHRGDPAAEETLVEVYYGSMSERRSCGGGRWPPSSARSAPPHRHTPGRSLCWAIWSSPERTGSKRWDTTGKPEGEGLRYASSRESGLDLAFSLIVSGAEADLTAAAVDSLIRSRALVLDEMADRWQGLARQDDPATEAGLELLRTRRAAGLSTHPYYWTGFVATGDWC